MKFSIGGLAITIEVSINPERKWKKLARQGKEVQAVHTLYYSKGFKGSVIAAREVVTSYLKEENNKKTKKTS